MNQLYILLLLVFLMCFTIYQWWFQGSRFKQMSDRDQAKIKVYNKPMAWMIYSLTLFIMVIILIGFNILKLMESVMKLEL